ncbi:hypothetical protein IFM89_034788 [Coptis chinensis]|uniref:Uncharacterized protein n=1 Tax=Coptis chinensis TaxID=261450 RepID=A0A835LHD2_9MAGN|nr:hypothetical protein IFM89_034788 [Coptis chinensis]
MAGKSSTYSLKKQHRLKKPLFKDLVDWVRPDTRGFHQCRPAFLRTGAVNAASGSAYVEFGSTKVIVSVFGPRESKKAMLYSDIGRLNCNVSYTTFATSIRGQGSDHKEYSSMLHKALEGAVMLESFPKTTVDVFALVLESGGSDLPVVISCASLALADAGIMMYDLVTSVSVSCLGKNLVLDPITEEESYQDGSLMITSMPSRNEVTQLTLTGEWSTPKIHEMARVITTTRWLRPYCDYIEDEGHLRSTCFKLHPELRPKNGRGKPRIAAISEVPFSSGEGGA